MKLLGTVAIIASALSASPVPLPQEAHRVLTVTASRYAFNPDQIEVHRGDVVKITFETRDIAHSFTIDELRICKRVTPGQSVTFEFHVDREGTFPFYCSLTDEDGCRQMHGLLVVR